MSQTPRHENLVRTTGFETHDCAPTRKWFANFTDQRLRCGVIEARFDIPFVAELALREKQIQQNYRPVIAVHKWFARRPGTLFRSLLLSEFCDSDLSSAFFK